jgi:hypothetical protein
VLKICAKSPRKTIRLFCDDGLGGKSSEIGTAGIGAGTEIFGAVGKETGGTTATFLGISLAGTASDFFPSPEKRDLIAKPANTTSSNGGATLAISRTV